MEKSFSYELPMIGKNGDFTVKGSIIAKTIGQAIEEAMLRAKEENKDCHCCGLIQIKEIK